AGVLARDHPVAVHPVDQPAGRCAARPAGSEDEGKGRMMAEHLEPVLSVQELRVATIGRPPPEILKGISFDIRPGETLCLVGESGSGKSVTSLVTMDLLPRDELQATGGAVLLQGEDILQATPARTRDLRGAAMAMIFQEPMTALN